ncbi:MAG: hydroxymethylbilane synthase [Rhodospirillales bacterium]|nr:hydroxymethylbilane synthase [Rhodospirillales bacterium]
MTPTTAPPHHPTLPLRVGTRPSPLALVQTRDVIARLREACPALREAGAIVECPIRTTGDTVQDRRLSELGGKGLFAKEIHEALRDGRIDLAVHSLKDLETALPEGVILGPVLPREDPRDALILPPGAPAPAAADPFAALARGARVGTASLRRQAQLLHARPDLRVVMLRGNVGTRLDKIAAGEADATLLALAGLRRLGLTAKAGIVLAPETMLPAAGQGIVGITLREADTELAALLAALGDPAAAAAATAERAVLAALDGSCRTPVGAYARLDPDGGLHLAALLARGDGSWLARREIAGPAAEAARLGATLGAALRAAAPSDVLA